MANIGRFIISLDYELYWGIRDILPLSYYRETMSGEREVVPMLLDLFERKQIHATWAVVGFMFFESLEELKANMPALTPDYKDSRLSPYPYIGKGELGNGECEDPDHFAYTSIKSIQACKHQTISTHTFSHYYCKEEGQTLEQFKADLRAAITIAEKKGIKIESIVFPRNQFNEEYIEALEEMGIHSYRGNPSHWIHREGYSHQDSIFKRAFRLLDSYINLSGHNCFSVEDMCQGYPVNLPASQFLRPYSKKLRFLERLRLRRIISGMTYAAKHGLAYHLWWHPYNLASNQKENMVFLKRIMDHFVMLKSKYGMVSANMEEITKQFHLNKSKVRKAQGETPLSNCDNIEFKINTEAGIA